MVLIDLELCYGCDGNTAAAELLLTMPLLLTVGGCLRYFGGDVDFGLIGDLFKGSGKSGMSWFCRTPQVGYTTHP